MFGQIAAFKAEATYIAMFAGVDIFSEIVKNRLIDAGRHLIQQSAQPAGGSVVITHIQDTAVDILHQSLEYPVGIHLLENLQPFSF
jgi:hypothetical protein